MERRITKFLEQAAESGDSKQAFRSKELLTAFTEDGLDIENLEMVMLYRAYLSNVYGDGEDRLQRVQNMSPEKAKKTLIRIMGDAEKLVEASQLLVEVLIWRRKRAATNNAKKAAAVKLSKDPKQAAKNEAFVLWQDWQSGHVLHKSGAAFARYVVERLPIESTKTVERWMQTWKESAGK
ncbi:MAG: hypothetical protein WKF61_05220 [Luteimonas sp.]